MRRESYSRGMRAFAASVLALMLIASCARGQSQHSTQPKESLVYPVSVIQIDAVVTRKDGKFVDGLGAQNFVLKEDGREQKISSIEHFVARAVHRAADAPILIDLETAHDPEKLRPVVHDHRMIVLFFGLATMTSEELERSVDLCQKFVKQQMTGADLVAVISFGTIFRIDSDFTSDRELLGRALASLVPPKKPEDAIDVNPSAEEISFNILFVDNLFYATQALAKLLGGIPGRKSVIQFNGSVAQNGESAPLTQRDTVNVANENVVSLYEVDLSDSTGPGPGQPVMEDPGDAAKFAAVMRSRKPLESLAHETGGALLADVKDFAPIFKQVQDDSQDYYLLSYYSMNTKRDGLFREVSVKLEKVPGAQTKFRPGYYGPTELVNPNSQH